MSTTPVAKGSVQLELDASRLNSELKSAAKNTKTQGKTIGENLKTSIGDKLNEVGGGTGIVAMGGKAGLIGASVAAIALVGSKLNEVYGPAVKLRKEFERNAEVTGQWGNLFSTRLNDIKDKLSDIGSIIGTDAGMLELERGIAKFGQMERDTAVQIEKLRELQDDYRGMLGSWDAAGKYFYGALGDKQADIKMQLDAVKAANLQAKQAAHDARKQLYLLQNPEENPKATNAIKFFIADLETQTKELEGQSKELSKLNALQKQYNLSRAQMRLGEKAIDNFKLAEATKEAKDLIKELETELYNLNSGVERMTEDIKLDELIKKGIDEDQINRLKMLIDLKRELNNEYKAAPAIEKGTAQEISFQNKYKFDTERRKDIDARIEGLKDRDNIAGKMQTEILKQQLTELKQIKHKLEKEVF